MSFLNFNLLLNSYITNQEDIPNQQQVRKTTRLNSFTWLITSKRTVAIVVLNVCLSTFSCFLWGCEITIFYSITPAGYPPPPPGKYVV